jgi:N-formylglutamate amidohydrolase
MSKPRRTKAGSTNYEARAAEERKKRRDACFDEYSAAMAEILKRHNCRAEMAVIIEGQQVPITKVLNCQVVMLIAANIE